jgi:Transposase DDE domain
LRHSDTRQDILPRGTSRTGCQFFVHELPIFWNEYSLTQNRENRNGLIVDAEVFQANGTAERDAALVMLEKIPGTQPLTVGGDKGFDTRDFVKECRHLRVVAHMAQNERRRGGSAIDGRTTRHSGYAVSQKKRKRIEECFGWLKTIALMRKVRHRGVCKVHWIFTLACAAYNLVRMRNLAAAVPAV